ncbi:nitric-oxide synthase [Klebsormidium nitens]|uniref:nitric-oxide synthase (NADPH) n=1 Tax=Klebsormidium nitens TaxID=105231 RepID=A0A1Y1II61_KLENI|nr:nitric-oxide synthase [Klebsormidium nitens]|eukprot:GAQ90484.1 nitric-oxide synthase [Klebsormidium nitens]
MEQHHNHANGGAQFANVSKCPFAHGSVGVFPYPGYVHGKNPTISVEYQDLFHKEFHSSPEVKAARIKEILESIEATGTYSHTFDELQHGARVSWRNAPKCSNRKFWDTIQLRDKRHVTTAEACTRPAWRCLNWLATLVLLSFSSQCSLLSIR